MMLEGSVESRVVKRLTKTRDIHTQSQSDILTAVRKRYTVRAGNIEINVNLSDKF